MPTTDRIKIAEVVAEPRDLEEGEALRLEQLQAELERSQALGAKTDDLQGKIGYLKLQKYEIRSPKPLTDSQISLWEAYYSKRKNWNEVNLSRFPQPVVDALLSNRDIFTSGFQYWSRSKESYTDGAVYGYCQQKVYLLARWAEYGKPPEVSDLIAHFEGQWFSDKEMPLEHWWYKDRRYRKKNARWAAFSACIGVATLVGIAIGLGYLAGYLASFSIPPQIWLLPLLSLLAWPYFYQRFYRKKFESLVRHNSILQQIRLETGESEKDMIARFWAREQKTKSPQ